MLVKQRLKINAFIMALSGIVIITVFLFSAQQVIKALDQNRIADSLVTASFERLALRSDYLRTGSDRAREQLGAKYRQIGELLKNAAGKFEDPEDKKTINSLIEGQESIGKIMRAIIKNRENASLTGGPSAASKEIEDRLLSQLDMRVYEAVLLEGRLQESSSEALISAFKLAAGGIAFVFVLVGAATLVNSGAAIRMITDRINRLRDGTAVIGGGDLNYRINLKGHDEFAELAESFNAMTDRLSKSYRDLEAEVNERKQAEDALRQAHEELETRVRERTQELREAEISMRLANAYNRNLIEVSVDPLVTISADGKITDVNAATETATGFSRADLIGTDFSNYFTEPQDARSGYERAFREGSVRAYELELRHRDGHATPVLYNASVYRDSQGNVIGVFAAARDITEQKQSQKALNELNASLEQRVAVRTSELRAANDSLRASRAAALNLMEDSLEARKQAEETSAQLLREVAERKRTADSLEQANSELEEVNRELESFIYSASHDLRAPLRSMSGFAEIIASKYSDGLDEKGKQYLTRICKGSSRMSRIIDDLLHLSRISRQDMTRVNVDLSRMASSIVSDFREAEPDRRVEIVIGEGIEAFADSGLIELALTNLIGNAWKFTSKTDSGRIEFGTLVKEDRTVYFVRDNGAGFEPKYAGKMFWPFHRLHSEEEFEGTGIGLAIVERIIRRHGGKVWAEGGVGNGATFYFTFDN